MSFRTNSYQQLSLTDSFSGLTFREQKALEHSWAKSFAEDIFPFINEEPFEVLYSSNASRPNTPVNVCIGALINEPPRGKPSSTVLGSYVAAHSTCLLHLLTHL